MLFTKAQLAYFSNTLNEILHGFAIADWEQQVPTSRADAERLLERFNEVYGRSSSAAGSEITLSSNDEALLVSATHLCSREFEEAEFQIRLGESREVGREYMQTFSRTA